MDGNVELFGRSLTNQELRRRVGRLDQVAGIEPLVLYDGLAGGVRALRVRTGSGLSFTVLLEKPPHRWPGIFSRPTASARTSPGSTRRRIRI